jgi:hypothetical protein
MDELSLALGPSVSEATGQHTLVLRLVKRTKTQCLLYGYPEVILSDRAGAIPFAIRHGGDQMITSRRPTRVVVRPRSGAFIVLNNYRCDRGVRRAATTIRVALPGATHRRGRSIAVADRYRRPGYCGRGDPGSTLAVSPFEPTLRAALRG